MGKLEVSAIGNLDPKMTLFDGYNVDFLATGGQRGIIYGLKRKQGPQGIA